MKQEIKIECSGAGNLSIDLMTVLQGDLKTISKEAMRNLKREIIQDGYSFPIALWEDKESSKLYILDGTQRFLALKSLRKDGYSIPALPIVMVEAESLKQAKHKLLAAASTYGKMSEQSLLEFLDGSMITTDEIMKNLNLNLDMTKVYESYNYTDNLTVVAEHTRSLTQTPKKKTEVVEPVAKSGDIYQLGDHKLICGNKSTEDVDVILNAWEKFTGQSAQIITPDKTILRKKNMEQ